MIEYAQNIVPSAACVRGFRFDGLSREARKSQVGAVIMRAAGRDAAWLRRRDAVFDEGFYMLPR